MFCELSELMHVIAPHVTVYHHAKKLDNEQACVYVFVCMCVRESARARAREEKQTRVWPFLPARAGVDSSQNLLTNLITNATIDHNISPDFTETLHENLADYELEPQHLRTESPRVNGVSHGGGQWHVYEVTLVRGVRVPTADCSSSTASRSSKF